MPTIIQSLDEPPTWPAVDGCVVYSENGWELYAQCGENADVAPSHGYDERDPQTLLDESDAVEAKQTAGGKIAPDRTKEAR